MEELKVIGVDRDSLLVAAEDGARFRLAIDDVLQSRLRREPPEPAGARRLSPREIQAHIRAGMSAEDVASVTGTDLEYVHRFEGPVLAEREFVIESALAVPVHLAVDTDPLAAGATFGTVIRQRLADIHAVGERWASWKEAQTGWVIKLTFVVETIDRDARWTFDPKRQALAPLNQEAISLSQQGELPASLVPRLRAVPIDEQPDVARFDSGAFAVQSAPGDTSPMLEPIPYGRVGEPSGPRRTPHTADLLDELRKRRGERDPMNPGPPDALAGHPSTGSVRLIDIPVELTDEVPVDSLPAPRPVTTANRTTGSHGKRGRAAMPSWDEIVFGARTDEDL